MTTITINEELLPSDLAQIHNWLMEDLHNALDWDPEEINGPLSMLHDFSALMWSSPSKSFNLFDESSSRCIGYIFFVYGSEFIELRSLGIAPDYRYCGWGKRFALTTIQIMKDIMSKRTDVSSEMPVRIFFNKMDDFWKKLGFDRINDKYMELTREVTFEPIS